MRDLISRQAVVDALEILPDDWKNVIAYKVEKIPARTGKWTYEYDEPAPLFMKKRWRCSACGDSNTYGMSDFCPCCGAMMENSTRRMKEAEDKSV